MDRLQFATADNTRFPQFFALYPEPLAWGVDTLAQLDWSQSRCPHCCQLHRKCAFAFRQALRPAGAVRGKGVLRRPMWCHCYPLRAVGPGAANARGSVLHVCRRSA